MEPISMAVMGAQMAVGMAGNQAANNARQQTYANNVAFQDAQQTFNTWQAGFNADMRNLNNEYKYWGETLAYNENLSYAHQLDNYELAKELAQAQKVLEARVAAGVNYVAMSEAIQAAYRERGVSEAVAEQQFMYRGLQASAAYQASASEGNSTDRYVRNASRQMGDYRSLKKLKEGFAENQYSRQQLGMITDYLNRYNSLQFYKKAPIKKPTMPFAPLPSMITPPQPYMQGSPPMDTRFLDNATTAFSALNTGLDLNKSIMREAAGGGGALSGLNNLFRRGLGMGELES